MRIGRSLHTLLSNCNVRHMKSWKIPEEWEAGTVPILRIAVGVGSDRRAPPRGLVLKNKFSAPDCSRQQSCELIRIL